MLELGKKIRLLRQKKGWSQLEVAQKIGLSPAAFSKIEKDVTDISISRIVQLAALFEVSLAELILDQNEENAIETTNSDELSRTKEQLDVSLSKIVHLQEYIITLYEELHQMKRKITEP